MPTPIHFHFKLGTRQLHLTGKSAFRLGYSLALRHRFLEAARVFAALEARLPRFRPAVLLQAFCQAQIGDYAACKTVLTQSSSLIGQENVESVHAAFVFRRLGMRQDSLRELMSVIKERPFPSLCLLTGTLLSEVGKPLQAVHWWKRACQSDGATGCVTGVAQEQVEQVLSATQCRK